MYQMSWAVNHGDNKIEDFFQFADTFEEVCEWVENIKEQEDVHHWVVSMVLGGSEPQHQEVYPEAEHEREMWQENAMLISQQGEYTASDSEGRATQVMRAFGMLPKSMNNAEVFATLMNFLNGYVSDDEEKRWMLKTCLASVDTMSDLAEKAKRMIN